MNSIIFKDHKRTTLIDLLLQGDFDKNLPLTVTLVSCYFSSTAANKIISDLVNKLRSKGLKLEKIQFYIDRGIALEIGKNKLCGFLEKLKSEYPHLTIEFNLINQVSMFHCKAYCLSQNNEQDSLVKGSLVIGSANLTKAALTETDPQGNIELLLGTQETKSIVSLFEDLKKLDHIPLSEIEKFNNDDYYFKFALIKEGIFVKNDDLKISELLTYTYKFNSKGKKERQTEKDREKNPEGKGFKTRPKNYFNKLDPQKYFKKYNKYYEIGWGDYGISTDFGYWIPQQLLDYLSNNEQVTQCKAHLKKELETHQDKALEEMKNDYDDYFIKQYWIDHISEFKTENYRKKIDDELKQLENRLKPLGKKPSTEQQEKERERVHFETMSNSEEETKVKQKIDEYCQQKLDNMKNDLLSDDHLKSLLYRYKLNELILSFHDNYNNTIYNIIYNDINKKLVREPETFERLKSKIKRIVSLQNDNPDLSQDYEKVTREIIKECFETKGYLIQKCLLISIITRDLGYIRWLKTEDFLRERGKKRAVKSPQTE